MIDRRRFLSHACRAAFATCAAYQAPRWLIRSAEAAETERTLLTIFLRGGCDGLNCVVPYADDDYHRMRPTIRVPAPGPGAQDPALKLDDYFGLHPMLRGLSTLYNQGRLAVLPAVHYRDASRSHFEGQATLEQAGAVDGSGWLNRYLLATGASSALRGVALAQNAPDALKGELPVRILNSLRASSLSEDPDEEARLNAVLHEQYRPLQGAAESVALRAIRQSGALALQDLGFLRALGAADYRPSGGASYPSNLLGTQLQDAALLVKAELGLRVATIDFGGWDTHTAQGNGAPDGRQARALAELDAGLTAFMTDLGSHASRVAVLVMSEFGRTADQNASGGTDHGNAAAWFVLGGAIRGGIYNGATGWPGLAREQLRDGRDLAHALEFRAVMAELLIRHLDLPAAALPMVLPGSAVAPIGFL
jgi:uncharacterized protein (DUF1501 family)